MCRFGDVQMNIGERKCESVRVGEKAFMNNVCMRHTFTLSHLHTFSLLNLKKYLVILLFTLPVTKSFAQNYFQQEVNYTIHVSLNDVKHELSATEKIEYTNHSPNTLNELYFHLWANAYKNENTALANEFQKSGDPKFLNAKEEERGFIDSLNFESDGIKIEWNLLTDTIDICKLTLNKPLAPGEKITITTPFHVKIPSALISRLGHLQQSYFITQWFPKPAVYGNNGWNYFPYINKGEFYSEFGVFDVFITLPKNYVVGATGDLVEGEKEIEWLDEKVTETKAIVNFEKEMSFPPSSSETKTLHYHAEKVHDFAWFADKRWHVLKEDIELPVSKRKVTAWMMFTNAEANYWLKSPEYMKSSIDYFSKWIGEYPYNNVTAVDVTDAEGNGMEYPAITTIGNYGDPFELEVTIAHELGHNWFYGILGSNERRHPWMDEGLTNFLETRYVYTKYSGKAEMQLEGFSKLENEPLSFGLNKLNHRKIQYLDYLYGARNNSGQAPETSAEKVSFVNYHDDVYYKTALSFDFLKSYLGDSLFDICMNRYFEEWKFKHPQPEDLKNVFTITSGKNLDWLFEDLIKTTKKLDYKLSGIKSSADKNNFMLTVKNSGDVASPFSISSLKNGETKQTQWLEGFNGSHELSMSCNDCDAFKIDAEEKMPELWQKNNTIRTNGMLKKLEPIRFQFVGGFEDPKKTQLYYSPVIGWNNYNKLMAGGAFYNIFVPEKKFEYVLMPMFAFGTSDLTGGGNISYNFYPKESRLHIIQVSVGAQNYSYANDEYEKTDGSIETSQLKFGKLDSRINFFILPVDRAEKIKYEITLRNILINKDLPYFYNNKPSSKLISLYELNFNMNRYNKLNPADFTLKVRGNENLLLAYIEDKFRIIYGDPDKGLDVRFFAGNIFNRNTSLQGEDYRFQLSGYSGSSDYLFDEVFLGRTESKGVLSQQFIATEGGFAMPTYFYRQANKWLAALNLKTTVPGILPLRIFADIGTFDHADELTNGSSISYEAGIEINVIKDIFTVYFPFFYSDDIQYVVDNEKLNFGNQIRFELHLNKLNPFTLIKKIEL